MLQITVRQLWAHCSQADAPWASCERLALACALGSLSCHNGGPGAGVAACLCSALSRIQAWNSCSDSDARTASMQCVRAAVSVLEYIVEEARFASERRPPSEAASHFSSGDALSFERDAFHIRPPGVLTGARLPTAPSVPGSTPTASLPSSHVDADRQNTSTVRALAQSRSAVLMGCTSTATLALATSRASSDPAVQAGAGKLVQGTIRAVCAWLTCPLVAEVSAADGVTPSGPNSLLSPGAGAPSVLIPVAIDLVQLHRDDAQHALDIVLFALTRVPAAQTSAREALSKLLHPPSVSASDLRAMVTGTLDGALRELHIASGHQGSSREGERLLHCMSLLQDASQRIHLAQQKQAAVADLTRRAVAAVHDAHSAECSSSSCLAPHVAVGDAVMLALGLPAESPSAAKRRDSVGSAGGGSGAGEQLVLNQAQMLAVDLLLNHAPVVLLGTAPQATVVAAAVFDLLVFLLWARLPGVQALQNMQVFHGNAQFCGVALGLSSKQCAVMVQQHGWESLPDASALWVAVCEQRAVLHACQQVKATMCSHRAFVLAQYVNAVGSTDATTAETALVASSDILPSLALSADESPFFCSRAAAEMDEMQHPLSEFAATLVSAVLGQWTGMLWGSSQFVWHSVAQFFRDSPLANGTAPTWMHETLADALTSLLQHVAPPAQATQVLLDTVHAAVAYVRSPGSDDGQGTSRQLRLAMGMQYLSAACCALRVAVIRLVASTGTGELVDRMETEVAEHGDSITQGGAAQQGQYAVSGLFVSGADAAAGRFAPARPSSAKVSVVGNTADEAESKSGAAQVLLAVAEALIQVVHACAESLDGAVLGGSDTASLLVAATDALRALQPLQAWCVVSANHLLPALMGSAVEIFSVLWRLQAAAVVQSLTHAVQADPNVSISPRSARALSAARYSGLASDDEDSDDMSGDSHEEHARDHPIVSAWLAHAMDSVGERDGDASSAGGPWNHSTSDFAAYALQEGVRGDRDAFVHNLRVCCVPTWTSPASRAIDCAANAARELMEKCVTVAVHNGLVGSASVPREASTSLLLNTSRSAAVAFTQLSSQLDWSMQQQLPAGHGSTVFGVMAPVLASSLASVVSTVSTAHGWLRYMSDTPAAGSADLGKMDSLLLALMRQLQVHDEETNGGSSSVPMPITARVVAVCGLLSAMTSGRAKWVGQHWEAARVVLCTSAQQQHPLLSLVSGFHTVWGGVTELVASWQASPPALSSYSALLGNILAHMGLAGVRHAPLLRLFVNHLTDVASASPAQSGDALRALASAVIAAMPAAGGGSSDAACLSPAELGSMCVATLPQAAVMVEAVLLPHFRRCAAYALHPQQPGAAGQSPPQHSPSRSSSDVAMATATLREAVALLQAVLSWCPSAMVLATVPGDTCQLSAAAAASALQMSQPSLPSVWYLSVLIRTVVHSAALPPVASACVGSSVVLQQAALLDVAAAVQAAQGMGTNSASGSQGVVETLLHSAAAVQQLAPGTACPLLPALAAPLSRCLAAAGVALEAATSASHGNALRDKWVAAAHDTCVRFFDGVLGCGILASPLEKCSTDDAVASYVLQSALSVGILLESMVGGSCVGAAAGCQPWRRRSAGRGSVSRQASVPRMLDRCLGLRGGAEGTARSVMQVLVCSLVPSTLLSWQCAGGVLSQLHMQQAPSTSPQGVGAAMRVLCPTLVDPLAALAGIALTDRQLTAAPPALAQAAALWSALLKGESHAGASGAAAVLLTVTASALAGTLAPQAMAAAMDSGVADGSSISRGGVRLGGGRRGVQGGGTRRGLRVAVSSGPAADAGRVKHASFA